MFSNKKLLRSINRKVTDLAVKMERIKMMDYVHFIEHPYRTLWANFINGIVRGLGIAIGFTLISALLIIVLQWVVKANLPGISQFIAELLKLVNFYNETKV